MSVGIRLDTAIGGQYEIALTNSGSVLKFLSHEEAEYLVDRLQWALYQSAALAQRDTPPEPQPAPEPEPVAMVQPLDDDEPF